MTDLALTPLPTATAIKFKPSPYADFMQSAKVRTPKYKFYVEIGGAPDAPTILLIMGLGAQCLVWHNDFCERLIQAGFRVIRFDNRDIGKSSKLKHKNALTHQLFSPKQKYRTQLGLLAKYKFGLPLASLTVPYDLYDMAEDVHQLMNVLAIKQCHIIGMSMGGMIAQILAAQQPDRVTKLGLLSTSNNRLFAQPPALSSLKTLLRPPPDKQEKHALYQHLVTSLKTIASPSYFDEQQTYEKVRLLTERKYYPKGQKRQLLAVLATGSLVAVNKTISQPTLIVHGAADSLIPPSHAKSLAKHIRHSKLVIIQSLGHDIPQALAVALAELFIDHFQ